MFSVRAHRLLLADFRQENNLRPRFIQDIQIAANPGRFGSPHLWKRFLFLKTLRLAIELLNA